MHMIIMDYVVLSLDELQTSQEIMKSKVLMWIKIIVAMIQHE